MVFFIDVYFQGIRQGIVLHKIHPFNQGRRYRFVRWVGAVFANHIGIRTAQEDRPFDVQRVVACGALVPGRKKAVQRKEFNEIGMENHIDFFTFFQMD